MLMIRLVWYVNSIRPVFRPSTSPSLNLEPETNVFKMAIMSVVNAEKEGHLESKIAKARQLEEIREAKRKEAEARKSDKDQAFEERKQDLKKKRKRHSEPGAGGNKDEGDKIKEKDRKFKQRKRVSFG